MLLMWAVSAPLLWRRFKRKFRSKKLVPESTPVKNTTRRKSISSKAWKPSGNGRECSSETRMNAVCIILVYEVVDNSIDEHLAGFCTKIEVIIHVDGSISVRDNGRGIPVDIHPKWKMPAVELVLTNLHAGGKFGQGAYKYSGGLHGVGAKCTNALSEWFKVEVSRDGKVYHMAFAQGKTTHKLTIIGEVKNKKTTGTLITFLPDPVIFTITIEFKFERLATRLRELAFLNPGLEIMLSGRTRRSAEEGAILLQIRDRRVRSAIRREQTSAASQTDCDLTTARRSFCRCRAPVQRQLQRPDFAVCEFHLEP